METVKLSRIVMKLTPELAPFLKPKEMNSDIVLRYGIDALQAEDVKEIVQFSIFEHQRNAYIH